jgi:peptidoglycan/xylan/chitin deacetylase (PgdA/CDA1 family)
MKRNSLGTGYNIKVLLYHRINFDGESTKSDFSIDATIFRKQMEFLAAKGFTTITFKDFLSFLDGELDLPRKPVIVTFDDGYQRVHEVALPIMKGLGMKGVVFIVADASLRTNAWDAQLGIDMWELLDRRQILDLHHAGFEIGSHTMTHRDLSSLPAKEVWEEIYHSRAVLEELIDYPVETFSYPFGIINESIKNLVAEAGYGGAFGGWSGPLNFGVDRLEIRRIAIFRSVTMFGFALRLLTPYEKYRMGRWQLRKLGEYAGQFLSSSRS